MFKKIAKFIGVWVLLVAFFAVFALCPQLIAVAFISLIVWEIVN